MRVDDYTLVINVVKTIMDSEIKEKEKNLAATELEIPKDEPIDVSELYTPLSVAKEEIWKRWNDKELRKKVEDFLGEMPEPFKDKPKAALFRFIATPNFEFKLFSDMAKQIELSPIFMEYLDDKFCTRNQDKIYLGKVVLFHKKNGEKDSIICRKKVIDLEKNDNKVFKNIKTLWGENLIDFHHNLFSKYYPNVERFNVSDFRSNGENSYETYLKVFSLFLNHGILFENYFVNANVDERRFTLEVVKPAFMKIKEIFGVKPLIVPLISYKEEGDLFWQYYPDNIKGDI